VSRDYYSNDLAAAQRDAENAEWPGERERYDDAEADTHDLIVWEVDAGLARLIAAHNAALLANDRSGRAA
jgi:hypothetical protein